MRGTEVNPGNASVFSLLFVVVPALSSSCCPLFFQFPFWTRLSLFEGTFTGRVMTMFGYDTSLGLSLNKKQLVWMGCCKDKEHTAYTNTCGRILAAETTGCLL